MLTGKISLYGKVHYAHPTVTVYNPTRKAHIPQPLCGQRSSRFYPHLIAPETAATLDVSCVKCRNKAEGLSDAALAMSIDCRVCGSRVYRGAVKCGGCGSPRPDVDGWAKA